MFICLPSDDTFWAFGRERSNQVRKLIWALLSAPLAKARSIRPVIFIERDLFSLFFAEFFSCRDTSQLNVFYKYFTFLLQAGLCAHDHRRLSTNARSQRIWDRGRLCRLFEFFVG
jgi:hypothetical protein